MNVDLIPNTSKTFAKSPIFQRESKDLTHVSGKYPAYIIESFGRLRFSIFVLLNIFIVEQSSSISKPRRWSMVDNANNKSGIV